MRVCATLCAFEKTVIDAVLETSSSPPSRTSIPSNGTPYMSEWHFDFIFFRRLRFSSISNLPIRCCGVPGQRTQQSASPADFQIQAQLAPANRQRCIGDAGFPSVLIGSGSISSSTGRRFWFDFFFNGSHMVLVRFLHQVRGPHQSVLVRSSSIGSGSGSTTSNMPSSSTPPGSAPLRL